MSTRHGVSVHAAAHLQPLTGSAADYDRLIDTIGDARLVLLGAASHGTHEFNRERAAISRRLIIEKGFHGVAVEADWPDAVRVDRYVRAEGEDGDGNRALAGFRRFPAWVWRNTDVLNFVDWLRHHNRGAARPCGVHGLDLYSLQASTAAMLDYLDRTDPPAASHARDRYGCFDRCGSDGHGRDTERMFDARCEAAVVEQLVELRGRAAGHLLHDAVADDDAYFFAEQDARLIRNAERHYRSLFRSRADAWNVRERHMMETLQALVEHLSRDNGPAKLILWAHNTHLGDARATEMAQNGELNLGQLVREEYADDAVLVGFSTCTGTVTAAPDWDRPAERMRVQPAVDGSWEALFHSFGTGNFWMNLHDDAVCAALGEARLQRAIGVVYRPQSEHRSHYCRSDLCRQFDLLLHFDDTRAAKPLELTAGWQSGALPEARPSGR